MMQFFRKDADRSSELSIKPSFKWENQLRASQERLSTNSWQRPESLSLSEM